MKKIKIIFIVIGLLIGIVLLDTIQAKMFNNRPIFSIHKEQNSGTYLYVDEGLFVRHYNCTFDKEKTVFNFEKYICPLDSNSSIDFYISKDKNPSQKFKLYYDSKQKIYMTTNIKEFYIIDKADQKKETLNFFISHVFQTFDDSIKDITEQLNLEGILKDGGTKIYRSKEKDITLITCNTIDGNRDVYIGDYTLNYHNINLCNSDNFYK